MENQEGLHILEKVLLAFSHYDLQIGYVQGMNYLAGIMVYHAEEDIAFWLLVEIFEMFEMRDIYLPCTIFAKKLLSIFSVARVI